MTQFNGVTEKELKTILETDNGLCNSVRQNVPQLRDKARVVYAQVFASEVANPDRQQVMNALKAAKLAVLTLNGQQVAKKGIKIACYNAIKKGKMTIAKAQWDSKNTAIKLEATGAFAA